MCLLAYDTLVSHPVAACIQPVAKGLQDLGKTMTTFPWNDITFGEGEGVHFDVILEKFRQVELVMGRAIALIRKVGLSLLSFCIDFKNEFVLDVFILTLQSKSMFRIGIVSWTICVGGADTGGAGDCRLRRHRARECL